jgi:hypothetical protein
MYLKEISNHINRKATTREREREREREGGRESLLTTNFYNARYIVQIVNFDICVNKAKLLF